MTQAGPDSDGSNFIDALVEGAPPAAAAAALAALVNRASARLHTLARGQAAAYKAQAEWPAWAQLQNAARALVLQASTCRDLAARLPREAAPEPTPPTSAEPPQPPTPEQPAAHEPPQPSGPSTDAPGADAPPPGDPEDRPRAS